ncbi:MAG: peroxiredoxin, partial [Rhodocyclaceae bacterium]|nr:peroxiredoxin [Rhodocyclaceae bacterium]
MFSLPDADMEMFELGEALRDKHVVLYFYPRDNTPGCTTEAKEFTDLGGAFEALGVKVLGVSTDSLESNAKFRAEHSLGVILLSDKDYAASLAFGTWGEKSNYGKTGVGMIRSTFVIGPDGTIERVYTV